MKPKQIIILSVILAILALGILLKAGVRVFRGDDQVLTTQVFHMTPSWLEKIQIGRGVKASSVELGRENGVWKVKSLWNAKADLSKIKDLLDKLWAAERMQEFRGKGKELFPDFGITEQDAFSLKFFSANKTFIDLRLGIKKAGESYFIRKAGDDSVYLIDADMAGLLGIFNDFAEATPASLFWADLGLFSLDPEKVTKIMIYHLEADEKTPVLGLVREIDPKDSTKSLWKFERKVLTSIPDPDKVLKFIAILASLKAQKIVDPEGKGYGLEKPVWQMVVTEGDKKTLLSAGMKDAKEDFYYVKTSSEPSVFSLSGSFFGDLNVDDKHFLKDVPAVPAEKKNLPPGASKQAA